MNWDTTCSLNRIRGAFAAHFIGDALGGPYEFRWQDITGFNGEMVSPLSFFSRWTGKKTGLIGQTTDDTAMTLCLLSTIIMNNGQYNPNTAVTLYNQWTSNATMIGRNTRELLKYNCKPENVWSCFMSRWQRKFSDAETAYNQQSNGCMMRCLPFILLTDWKPGAYQDCYLTNPSKFAWEINQLYIYGLKLLCQGISGDVVYNKLKALTVNPKIKHLYGFVETNTGQDLKKQKGWVLKAYYCVLVALKFKGTLADFLTWLIKQGGDTDTNAAIAGAIIGAKHGYDILMKNEITKNNWQTVLNCDVSQSEIDNRQIYQGHDIESYLKNIGFANP